LKVRRVLGLGTFPIVKPVHGGQRRVDAIRKFYESIGIRYDHACIYDATIYPPGTVSGHDIPLGAPPAQYKFIPFVADLRSGWQAANDPASFEHFMRVIEALNPDALQLEHPFMWPLADQVLRRVGDRQLPVIYSSHNVEAPLKRSILLGSGVPGDVAARIHDEIETIEVEICSRAELIICVSKSDRDHYLKSRSEAGVIVVPNGVDRPPAVIPAGTAARKVFGDNRFLLLVGSNYPPNTEGACQLIIRDGAFHSPPIKTLGVCGGVSEGIHAHPEYRRFAVANGYRVHFFPSIEDDDLWALKDAAHGLVLAVGSGGGTSLKTAEALALGKWVIANTHALRGFEAFADAEGVINADNRTDFRRAMAKVLQSDPVEISARSREAREVLFWDRCFSDSGLAERLAG
jgi:glycosyltransferase involved in cell wall biosynthesis